MHFLDELRWRGQLHDVTDEAGLRALGPETSCYVGFEPSASSLHIGSVLPLITAMRVAKYGIKPIILFGGATGSIGDPSGKRTERLLQERSVIAANAQSISAQVRPMFERMGIAVEFVDNYDWTAEVTMLDFLRDVGKHFTVNYMLAKDSVTSRLESESGISFTEFSYMLLQSFDFLHLYQTKNCKIQFGASDQWGNITAGLELIRRKLQADAYAFCIPLLLNSQGQKMGKSEAGAIMIDPKQCSPYRLHQYFLNTTDADVIRLLKLFTFLNQDEIAAIEQEFLQAPQKRSAQKILADSVCTLVHGEEATRAAAKSAEVLFSGATLQGIPDAELLDIFAEVPSTVLERSVLATLSAADIFSQVGLSKSKGEARRLMESGGAYANNEKIGEATKPMVELAQQSSSIVVLRAGKKNYHLIKLT